MAVYPITGAYTSSLSPVTPYDQGAGVVWVLAFSALGDIDSGDPSYLRAFRSADSGQTWAAAGGETKEVLTQLGLGLATRVITRAHPEWPAQPYLYALYCTPDEQLHISRYDCATETWDQESSGDPDIVEALPGGFQNFLSWSFDFTEDDDAGGLLYNDPDGYLHPNTNYYARVSYVPITRSTLSFGAPVRVEDQPDNTIVFRAGDVRRGAAGTLHGFVSQGDPAFVEPDTTYQSVLRFTGAGPSAPALSTFVTGVTGYPYAAQREERGGDTYIYVLVARSNPSLGQSLWVGQSTSLGVTFTEVFDEAGAGLLDYPLAVAPNADIYRAWPSPAEDLERQTYDGATLGDLELAHDGAETIGTVGAGQFGSGSACVFSLVQAGEAQPLYFFGAAVLQILLGGAGIPSEEAFGKTHGLTGGGPPLTCGDPVIVPPQDTCGPVPVTPIPEDQRGRCDTLGFSY